MIHQFRNKKEIDGRKKIIRYIIILVIFLLFSILGGFSLFGKLVNYIGFPIWKMKIIIIENIDNKNYLIRTKKSLINENEILLKENEDIKVSMLDYEILKNENNKLKKLLGRLPEINNFILANILTKPNYSPYDTIIIDIGQNMGTKEGNQVYANGDVPIGKINKVYKKTSSVILYSSPGQRTEGMINGSNVSIELVGRGGGNFEMIIPFDLPSDEGIMIFLPGSQIEILAYIKEIISTSTDSIKKILLQSPVNIQNLKWVQVKKD